MAERSVRRAGRRAPCALLVAAPVLAVMASGCGAPTAPESEITDAVESAATSTDPSYCRETVTISYLEQRSGYEGETALIDCLQRSGVSDGTPSVVRVDEVTVDGDVATASAVHQGGWYDGATLRFRLIEDGDWRVDELLAIEDFDRKAYLRQYLASLRAPPFAVDNEAARCFANHVRNQSESELVTSQIDFDPLDATATAVRCDRDGVERLAMKTFSGPSYGLDADALDCAAAKLAAVSDAELARIYAQPPAQAQLLRDCGDTGG